MVSSSYLLWINKYRLLIDHTFRNGSSTVDFLVSAGVSQLCLMVKLWSGQIDRLTQWIDCSTWTTKVVGKKLDENSSRLPILLP